MKMTKMMKTVSLALAALCVAAAFGLYGPQADAGGSAAFFTGQIKPVLYVADVEESAPFFRDVLGFDLLGYTDGADGEPYYAEMAAGPLKFGLHDPTNDEQETWVGHQRIYFRVTDLEAHRQRVIESGGSPGEVVETAWMDFFIVRDLDGHEIVLAVTDESKHTMDPWQPPAVTGTCADVDRRYLVVMFGPPAVGKMTVGKELAELTGLKLFHKKKRTPKT